jgi:radical SAM protein with 4Fe4S-binding SPASM domain
MIKHLNSLAKELIGDINREINSYKVRGVYSLIFLTYRCTSRCKTCNVWKRKVEKDSELDWTEWNIVLERLRDYGIKTVEIFGGDALLRKDVIFKMIRFCAENGIKTYFPTNSILMDRETAEGLVRAGLDSIYFSLDGIESESDKIRGVSGTFVKIKKAIEYLVDARKGAQYPKINICSTLSNMNYEFFEQIIDFLKDYPVNAVYPRIVTEFSRQNIDASGINGILPEPYFVTSEDKSHLFSPAQTGHFRDTVHRLKANEGGKGAYVNFQGVDVAPDTAFTSGEYGFRRCLVCSTLVTITPNGDITSCPFYPNYILGNLYRQSRLDEIWGNRQHREFIKLQRSDKIMICRNCTMPIYYPTFPGNLHYYLKRTGEKVSNLI